MRGGHFSSQPAISHVLMRKEMGAMFTNCRRCIAALILLVSVLGTVPISEAQTAAPLNSDSVSYLQRATLAVKGLQSWYDKSTGLYRTTGWWNSANAITTLADYSRVADSKRFNPVFKNTFMAAQRLSPGFINHYYDDEGWWALAWIDAYDRTHRKPYLTAAESIFTNMSGGWSDACAGGIWWSKDRRYKNAIANELFLSVATDLAAHAKSSGERATYLAWANREWQWFSHSGMINSDHLVNDGLDSRCQNNHKTTWTYNQGVIIGGLTELYRLTLDPSLPAEAQSIAFAVLNDPILVDAHGVLHEPCEPNCGADGTQFKGIFIRNLRDLDQVSPRSQYEKFILANANSIWSHAHPPAYQLGEVWSAPNGRSNASTQTSAADALIAAAQSWASRPRPRR